jgi:hypothetical protein
VVTFTRRHYVLIGEMLRELPDQEKRKWFAKWDDIFRADNPRYQPDKFFEFVHPKVARAAEELADEMR